MSDIIEFLRRWGKKQPKTSFSTVGIAKICDDGIGT